MRSSADTITKIITKYLEKHSINNENPKWEVKKSNLGGYGLFARRPIQAGEIIFKDHPIILGPRNGTTSLICANCYKSQNLRFCERRCGLQLCSLQCQNGTSHIKECKLIRQWQNPKIAEEVKPEKLTKVLILIRSLLLSDEDKEVIECLKAHSYDYSMEINIIKNVLHFNLKENEEFFMRYVSSVLDSNAFEVIAGNEDGSSVKGLYSLTSLVNHSCTPNAYYVFDGNQRMIARASKYIPKNSEIFYSYTRFIWGTPTRRLYLYKTKHFLCKCERCRDPTEFGSYISALLCKFCKKGRVIALNPLISNGKWLCDSCGKITDNEDVALLSSSLGSILTSFRDADVNCMLKLLEEKLTSLVCDNNESVVALKYKIIWILGRKQGFSWIELSNNFLKIKEKFCRELLELLEKLRLGKCKMRGLLLYEIYSCFKETRKRGEKSGNVSKINEDDVQHNIFLEAADILKFDLAAPDEIKMFYKNCKENITINQF